MPNRNESVSLTLTEGHIILVAEVLRIEREGLKSCRWQTPKSC